MSGVRLAASFLAAFVPPDRRVELVDELEDEYRRLADEKGAAFAGRWCVGQITRSALPILDRWIEVRVLRSLARQCGVILPAREVDFRKLFCAITFLWIACAYLVLSTRHEPAFLPPGPVVRLPAGPSYSVALTGRDGRDRVEREDGPQFRSYARGADNGFLEIVFLPPASAAAGAVAWLLLNETFQARLRERRRAVLSKRATAAHTCPG